MKKNVRFHQIPFLVALTTLLITALGFQTRPLTTTTYLSDTLPDRNKKIRNIDEAIQQVDQAAGDVDLKKYDQDFKKIEAGMEKAVHGIHINEAELKKQLAAAMKQIELAKIQASVEKAFKEIDLKQIQASVHQSLNNLEMEKIKGKLDEAVSKIDLNQIRTEVNASISKINWDKMKDQLEEIKNIDRVKIENELHTIRPELKKSLKEAHRDLEQTKKECKPIRHL
ncbi:MAG: hypothetical protein NVS9B7_04470 [Flavisolibacter sp.]